MRCEFISSATSSFMRQVLQTSPRNTRKMDDRRSKGIFTTNFIYPPLLSNVRKMHPVLLPFLRLKFILEAFSTPSLSLPFINPSLPSLSLSQFTFGGHVDNLMLTVGTNDFRRLLYSTLHIFLFVLTPCLHCMDMRRRPHLRLSVTFLRALSLWCRFFTEHWAVMALCLRHSSDSFALLISSPYDIDTISMRVTGTNPSNDVQRF
jgi:hypothetical protein